MPASAAKEAAEQLVLHKVVEAIAYPGSVGELPEACEAADARGLAYRVVSRLRTAGHEAYLVGGCVRDLLLGLRPNDFDVATGATPDRILAIFPDAQPVGAHFGVVMVREGDLEVEVATFRTDHAYRDGRRPESVAFEANPWADVMRRDFTVNALLLDPQTNQVLDFVGGREDLSRRVVRTVGSPDARFREDRLRMLRAIRLAVRLGFTVDPSTLDAIRRHRGLIPSVSAERVRDEVMRILTEGGARRGFELLDETGLLDELLPEVSAMKGVEQPPEFHPEGDVWTHTLLMLDGMRNPTSSLALGVLLHDVGKPPTFTIAERIRFDHHVETGVEMSRHILARLRCPNDLIRRVEALVANHLRFKDVPRMRESTLRRFLRLEDFQEHLELHRLDCLSSHRNLDNYYFAKEKLETLTPAELKPPPLITGHDLIRCGYKPGPAFAAMLDAVESAQLESRVRTSEEAMALVRSLFVPPSGDPKPAGT